MSANIDEENKDSVVETEQEIQESTEPQVHEQVADGQEEAEHAAHEVAEAENPNDKNDDNTASVVERENEQEREEPQAAPENNVDLDDQTEPATDETKQRVQVSARVRKKLKWEDAEDCVQFDGNTLRITSVAKSLTGETVVDCIEFDKVFPAHKTNEELFDELCRPLCEATLYKGHNSIFIAYGQTGSGKTYTLLGKPDDNVCGVLPMCIQYFLDQDEVEKVTMSVLEVYGKSTQKINVYDLLDEDNLTNKWPEKKALNNRTVDIHSTLICTDIHGHEEATRLVHKAQQASHFAPTGRNQESSRGHIAFIFSIHREDKSVSNFVGVDLAGSEGESALTSEFTKKTSEKRVKSRRLEAGIINYGLSQLQQILEELRNKRLVSDFKESGLRKVLHPYINIETYISVLFTLSPSNSNIKATRGSLRVANMVSTIQIVPKLMKLKPSKHKQVDLIISDLKQTVKEQREQIQVFERELEEARTATTTKQQELEKQQESIKRLEAEITECKEKDAIIDQQKKDIESLRVKLEEIEAAAQGVEDIQLDIQDEPDADDKDAKIAELERRCQELTEQAKQKKCCACIVM